MAPLINPDESLQVYHRRLDGVAYTTYILIMLLVPLKIACRKRAGGWSNIRLDDYMSIVSLLCANGFFYVCIIGMRKTLGIHITAITDPNQIIDFLRSVYIGQILYVLSIVATKYSVLAFYWRLFSVNARIPIYIVTFMVTAWLIALIGMTVFNCIPVQAAWDITITGAKCLQTRTIYLGGSVPNVIIDVILVAMPLPHVWRLHAPLGQRLLLVGMFALGTFIAVVSLVRLIIFLQIPLSTAGDATYNFREIIVWSIVEVNIGLTCACLPSLKPALTMIGLDRLFALSSHSKLSNEQSPGPSRSWPTHGTSNSRPRKKGSTGGLFSTLAGISKYDSEEEGFKIVDNESAHGKNNVEIEMARMSNDSSQKNIQREGISVQKDWSVFVNDSKGNRRV